MSKRTVLVTGMSGLIGNALKNALGTKYELSALNRRPVEGVKSHQADISNLVEIMPAFEGIDTVVHLAAVATVKATWQEYLDTNVVGTYNVFEASRTAHVRRVIYASSGGVILGWEKIEPIKAICEGRYAEVPVPWPKVTHESALMPVGIYSCTKIWGEALARRYADECDMSAICIRVGRVNQENRPTVPREYSVWCSYRDLASMVERCIEAPASLRFDIFYAQSNNKWGYRDIEHARQVIGYAPQDSADNYPQMPVE